MGVSKLKTCKKNTSRHCNSFKLVSKGSIGHHDTKNISKCSAILKIIKKHLKEDSRNKDILKKKIIEVYENEAKNVEITFANNVKGYYPTDILTSNSQYFNRLLNGPYLPSDHRKLQLYSVVKEGFDAVLILLKKDNNSKINILKSLKEQILIELFDVSTFLFLDKSTTKIVNELWVRITDDNIVIMYMLTKMRDINFSKKLFTRISFIFNKLYLNKTYLLLDEEDILNLLLNPLTNINISNDYSILSSYLEARIKNFPEKKNDQLWLYLYNICNEVSKIGSSEVFGITKRYPNRVVLNIGGVSSLGITNECEIFNPSDERWYYGPSFLSTNLPPLSMHGLCSNESYIYCLGGTSHIKYKRSSCYRFSLETLDWEEICSGQVSRQYCGTGMLHNLFPIIVGGKDERRRFKTCEIFLPQLNNWKQTSNMSEIRSDFASSSFNDIFFVAGGFNGDKVLSVAEYYDYTRNEWIDICSKMKHARYGTRGVFLNGRFIVTGGTEITGSTALTSCEYYDPREGKFFSMKNKLINGRSSHGCTVFGDKIIVSGGINEKENKILETCEIFDSRLDRWLLTDSISDCKSNLQSVCIEYSSKIPQFLPHCK
ncbi:Nrf2-associated protein keap1b [Strongyloides ratti]|uniref:Nrf2-associated protein keap1b n=1 Tax=Strongyloides ratti TaxID=34506 RepID=A0A090LJI6_STRRB|nr:Nrf2-associated protein keap1b [Strongyloides ratti]CEF69997.1 Nrf2-associated protein keap1b [Strongyloides ratti]